MARVALLLSLAFAFTACSLIKRARGITDNYRTDGLAVLDVRVSGLTCCGAARLPTDSVVISLQGPKGNAPVDTLTMLADRYGHAVFEGVQPGKYTLRIKPASYLITAQRNITLAANAKHVITHEFGFREENRFRTTPRR